VRRQTSNNKRGDKKEQTWSRQVASRDLPMSQLFDELPTQRWGKEL
jgi:uncharacterized protein YceK